MSNPDYMYPENYHRPERVDFIEDPRVTRREARILGLVYDTPRTLEEIKQKLSKYKYPDGTVEEDVEFLDTACAIEELTKEEYFIHLNRRNPTNEEIADHTKFSGRYLATRSGRIVHEAHVDQVRSSWRDWIIAVASSVLGGISGYIIGLLQ